MYNDPLIGQQLANFKIERVLGRGGMAQVYLAQDVQLQRPVAVKVIDVRFRGDPDFARRFVSEARVIATWRHEHVVQVYYADEQDGLYYFVMEYIDGLNLATLMAQYVADGAMMPHDDVLEIGWAVAAALDYAHERDVIHRDVKPSNVMVAIDRRIVLTDFGLALDVQQGSLGEVFGTPHYVAPEQARRSSDAVPQSDLYSLGVMLYEMLTGAVPFDDPSPAVLAIQHISQPPPPPRSINPELNADTEHVLLNALSKLPELRYQNANDLLTALEGALSSGDATTNDAPSSPPEIIPVRRTVSGQSISEKVALHVDAQSTQALPDAPTTKEADGTSSTRHFDTTKQSSQSKRGVMIGGAVLLIPVLIVIVIVVVLAGGDGDDPQQAAPLPTSAEEGLTQQAALATATDAVTETAVIIPTDTASPAPTLTLPPSEPPLPSATPIPPTMTPVPPTATVIPTFTPAPPTPIPPTAVPTAAGPTAAPAGWGLSRMIYNDNAFYWMNDTGRSIRINEYSFERLNGSRSFSGDRLAFWTMEAGRCITVTFADQGGVNCPEGRRPNAWFTATRSQDVDFWTGGGRFRVLHQGQEIAVCEVAAGSCEVYLP